MAGATEYEDYQAEWKAKADLLYAEWHKSGSTHDAELQSNLILAAIRAERPQVVEEVAAGGDVAAKEIKLPTEVAPLPLKVLFDFGVLPPGPYSEQTPWVIRRMTKNHFEVWLPKHGWLFNGEGKLESEAFPPRRDGKGREWYGAFLPDGQWVTTDLWESDRTLHFFSAKGKWRKDRTAKQLAPPKDPLAFSDILGWARCDKRGKGWVVSIGANGGRAIVFVTPKGEARELKGSEPWQLCYLRDMEPKGMFTCLSRPSDDGKTRMEFHSPSHGPQVGFPEYNFAHAEVRIAGGDTNFGFFPGSDKVFIGASPYTWNANEPPKTWFFNPDGTCLGWIRGAYLTDSADGKAMLFLDANGDVVTMSTELVSKSRERFTVDGVPAIASRLFPDLHLGLFRVKEELILARW
ncbi:MAG: hypothetical protein ABIP97_08945 [Chthoniobacterales bacterium]